MHNFHTNLASILEIYIFLGAEGVLSKFRDMELAKGHPQTSLGTIGTLHSHTNYE